MWERWMTLRNKLLLAMASVMLILLTMIASGVSIYVVRSEEAAWQSRQMADAQQAALVVETFLEKARAALMLLALFDQDDLANHPEHLDGLLRQHPNLLEVVRLDAEGTVIATDYLDQQLLGSGFPVILANWFQVAQRGEEYLGNVQLSAEKRPYVIMALPGPNGEILAARLKMELLWEIVSDLRFSPTSKAYVIDHGGRLLAHTTSETVAAFNTINNRPEFAAIIEATDNAWYGPYINLYGERVYGASTELAGTDWIIVTEVTQNELFRLSRSARLVLGSSMLIFAVLIMAATFYVLQIFIFTPINALYKGTQRIGQGDLDHRIPVIYQNEISQVARAFNEMAGNLHERDIQIQARSAALASEVAQRQAAEFALVQANEALESKVVERTESLRELQARLEHLLTSSAAVIYSLSLVGTPVPTFFSSNVETLTGYPADAFFTAADFWYEHIHPEDRAAVAAAMANLQKTKQGGG